MDDSLTTAVAVSSDRALVAECVVAALSAATGLEVIMVPWPEAASADSRWEVMVGLPATAIILCELAPGTLGAARRMAHAYPERCLLLTDAPPGPLWGAMLDASVVDILPSSITLTELVAVIDSVVADTYHRGPVDRDTFVAAWHERRREWEEVAALVATLSRRELEVLHDLRAGLTVGQIAEQRGVATSTVRTQVRAILRKLRVHTQLAAVAVLIQAEDEERSLNESGP